MSDKVIECQTCFRTFVNQAQFGQHSRICRGGKARNTFGQKSRKFIDKSLCHQYKYSYLEKQSKSSLEIKSRFIVNIGGDNSKWKQIGKENDLHDNAVKNFLKSQNLAAVHFTVRHRKESGLIIANFIMRKVEQTSASIHSAKKQIESAIDCVIAHLPQCIKMEMHLCKVANCKELVIRDTEGYCSRHRAQKYHSQTTKNKKKQRKTKKRSLPSNTNDEANIPPLIKEDSSKEPSPKKPKTDDEPSTPSKVEIPQSLPPIPTFTEVEQDVPAIIQIPEMKTQPAPIPTFSEAPYVAPIQIPQLNITTATTTMPSISIPTIPQMIEAPQIEIPHFFDEPYMDMHNAEDFSIGSSWMDDSAMFDMPTIPSCKLNDFECFRNSIIYLAEDVVYKLLNKNCFIFQTPKNLKNVTLNQSMLRQNGMNLISINYATSQPNTKQILQKNDSLITFGLAKDIKAYLGQTNNASMIIKNAESIRFNQFCSDLIKYYILYCPVPDYLFGATLSQIRLYEYGINVLSINLKVEHALKMGRTPFKPGDILLCCFDRADGKRRQLFDAFDAIQKKHGFLF